MCESSLIGTLVNDHSILHIISSVRDNRNNSVRSVRVLSEIVLSILLSLDKWLLWED